MKPRENVVFGACWQLGQLPVSGDALRRAIELNGTKVKENLRAFDVGRWAALNGEAVASMLASEVVELPKTLEDEIALREAHLVEYQGPALAKRYRKLVDRADDAALKEAIAKGYHKVLAYKDEFEVARLLEGTRAKAEEAFAGELKLTYHLAPPLLSRSVNGRPEKRGFKSEWLWPRLAKLKWLRGTPINPFGYSKDRRLERRLIRLYEADMKRVLKKQKRNPEVAVALAELPLQVKGFGPVKEANAKAMEVRRDELLAAFRDGGKLEAA